MIPGIVAGQMRVAGGGTTPVRPVPSDAALVAALPAMEWPQ